MMALLQVVNLVRQVHPADCLQSRPCLAPHETPFPITWNPQAPNAGLTRGWATSDKGIKVGKRAAPGDNIAPEGEAQFQGIPLAEMCQKDSLSG